MIKDSELAQVLRDTGIGEMIMVGRILKGLTTEEIAWVVLEAAKVKEGIRFTLHGYWHDIFVVSKVVILTPDDKLIWRKSGA